jgi:hypothetical protein
MLNCPDTERLCAEHHVLFIVMFNFTMMSVVMLICPNAERNFAKCPYAECHYAKCPYAECHVLFIVLLSAILLIIIMLNVLMSLS